MVDNPLQVALHVPLAIIEKAECPIRNFMCSSAFRWDDAQPNAAFSRKIIVPKEDQTDQKSVLTSSSRLEQSISIIEKCEICSPVSELS